MAFSYWGFILLFLSVIMDTAAAAGSGLDKEVYVSWAADHVKFLNSGKELQLTLDQASGSGFASKNKYLFGDINMQLKLVPGDSAGTVTAYYLASEGSNRDELDFEFLGNKSGQPYVLQTNVYAGGKGDREQRIYLWFDPTTDFHSYGAIWTPQNILYYHTSNSSLHSIRLKTSQFSCFICFHEVFLEKIDFNNMFENCRFMVDGVPIREFKNNKAMGVAYPERQAMGVYSSIWNGDSWATRGGIDKVDWSHAPFVAAYRNFYVGRATDSSSQKAVLSIEQRKKLRWVKTNFMIYNYCTDKQRYPVPPPECSVNM